MKHHNIGRGKIMSVAKAALVQFWKQRPAFVYSGDIDFFHGAIDIAGRSISDQELITRFYRALGLHRSGKKAGRFRDGGEGPRILISHHQREMSG